MVQRKLQRTLVGSADQKKDQSIGTHYTAKQISFITLAIHAFQASNDVS